MWLQVCITMSPLTPFLTETMYRNLRRCLPPDAPESVHFQSIPEAAPEAEGDPQIVHSVARMQAVIELGRVARERQNRPLRTPLKRLTVAHSDAAFLADLNGALVLCFHHQMHPDRRMPGRRVPAHRPPRTHAAHTLCAPRTAKRCRKRQLERRRSHMHGYKGFRGRPCQCR